MNDPDRSVSPARVARSTDQLGARSKKTKRAKKHAKKLRAAKKHLLSLARAALPDLSAQAFSLGLSLRSSYIASKRNPSAADHWMFESSISSRRILDYWPSTQYARSPLTSQSFHSLSPQQALLTAAHLALHEFQDPGNSKVRM